MRSMTNNTQSKYFLSTIIEHDSLENPFKILVKWLKTQNNYEWNQSNLLNNPSFTFVNPESETIKIENIRNLQQELAYSNYNNEKRYFILFNSDQTTLQAQNASLKSIEEPPKNTQIVLLTSSIEKLLPTIISRCEVIPLKQNYNPGGGLNTSQDQETANIYQKIISSKHYQLIEMSNEYKERVDAILLFNKLLKFLHNELRNPSSKYENKRLTKHLKIILMTIEQLNKNVNVKLATENAFFELIGD